MYNSARRGQHGLEASVVSGGPRRGDEHPAEARGRVQESRGARDLLRRQTCSFRVSGRVLRAHVTHNQFGAPHRVLIPSITRNRQKFVRTVDSLANLKFGRFKPPRNSHEFYETNRPTSSSPLLLTKLQWRSSQWRSFEKMQKPNLKVELEHYATELCVHLVLKIRECSLRRI